MNIYEKLQECRAKLMSNQLTQSGENSYSKYKYFELGDFLPKAIEIMKDLKIASVFGFKIGEATLTIINSEAPEEKIEFSSPSVITEMKGCNQIQNIGASQTYMRRYLYTMALELSDYDLVNALEDGNTAKSDGEITQKEIEEIENKPLQDIHVKTLKKEMERTGIQIKQFPSDCKVEKLEELDLKQFKRLMTLFEPMESKKQTNLDL